MNPINSFLLETYKDSLLVINAFYLAMKGHHNQFRKKDGGNSIPYFTHCLAVAEILYKTGIRDEVSIATALLHDTIEDVEKITALSLIDDIKYEVARNVYFLSRNTLKLEDLEEYSIFLPKKGNKIIQKNNKNLKKYHEPLYKIRLVTKANKLTQIVKIADNIHNFEDPHNLILASRKKKLNDYFQLYGPLGRIIAPKLTLKLEENIEKYLKENPGLEKLRINYGYGRRGYEEFVFKYLANLQEGKFN